jgi:hypothetical protein
VIVATVVVAGMIMRVGVVVMMVVVRHGAKNRSR